MLIIIAALSWLAIMVVVVAVCVMAAHGDGSAGGDVEPVLVDSGIVAPAVDQTAPRLAQPL